MKFSYGQPATKFSGGFDDKACRRHASTIGDFLYTTGAIGRISRSQAELAPDETATADLTANNRLGAA